MSADVAAICRGMLDSGVVVSDATMDRLTRGNFYGRTWAQLTTAAHRIEQGDFTAEEAMRWAQERSAE